MANTSLLHRLHKHVSALRAANTANVTITFALATVPIVGFVGAAVDYSHANRVKAAMQAAADSTALLLSKDAAALTDSQLQTKANDYFKALFTRADATSLLVSATYSAATGSKVTVNASSNVKTNFMGLLGFSQLKVGVDSQVNWGSTRLRVALALDNTGSMADDGKMDALKTATKSLLTQLKSAAAKDGDVLVSIVPFSKDVNVGKTNNGASWLDWSIWDAANSGSSSSGISGSICYNGQLWQVSGTSWSYGGACTGTSTGICYNGTLWNWNGVSFISSGNCSNNTHNTWNGCVTDRGLPALPSVLNTDTNVLGVTADLATKFVPEQYAACPQAVMTLGSDWTAMNSLVDSMSPGGMTNQNIGLAHAWLSLVGGGPYPTPPAEDPNFKYTKIIILLTDGLNTQNRWYTSQSQIDARQKLTCDNINAAGITLYTIQVNTGGDPTQSVLQNCAGSPGTYPDREKFFLLTSATQMVTTFQKIGTMVSKLRIAQ